MKVKSFLAMAALALFATSCSDDDVKYTTTTYEGENTITVHLPGHDQVSEPSPAKLTLMVGDNSTLNMLIAGSTGSMEKAGSMEMPDVELKNIQVVKTSDSEYTFGIAAKDTMKVIFPETKKVFMCTNMKGQVKDGKLILTYDHQYGAMPFWMSNDIKAFAK